jgi:hypothetical protein
MKGYQVEIATASKELSARERIKYKDTSLAVRLDEATEKGTEVIITPVDYVILDVHNEFAKDDKDYKNYIIVDKSGEMYLTGSESFWSSFEDIWDDMSGENEEYQIKAYRLPSKNYNGKSFLTCSII